MSEGRSQLKRYSSKAAKVSRLVFLAVVLLTATGCGRETVQTLVDVMLATCGENTAFLSRWWDDMPGTSNIEIDPIGGYLFLYWVDQDGNACHGVPGVSGQPGPIVIRAFHGAAYSSASQNAIISIDEMEEFQQIPIQPEDYAVAGLHFVQFDNVMWRSREDGIALRDRAAHRFSYPRIASLDHGFCMFPEYAYNQPDCGRHDAFLLPSLPGDGPAQHPTKCKARAMPSEISLSYEELLDYCVVSLPHGLEVAH